MVILALQFQRVGLRIGTEIGKRREGLGAKPVVGEVVTEAQMMARQRSVVEGHAITHVVDGGVIAVLGVRNGRFFAVFVGVIVERIEAREVVGVDAGEVGKELR